MKRIIRVLMTISLILVGFAAHAEDPKINGKEHPRRKEVVDRAQREKDKNNAAAVNGKITDAQARKLDRKDNNIEKQEQADAAKNGGHITKQEQKQLNHEENKVNQERNQMEQKDAAGK